MVGKLGEEPFEPEFSYSGSEDIQDLHNRIEELNEIQKARKSSIDKIQKGITDAIDSIENKEDIEDIKVMIVSLNDMNRDLEELKNGGYQKKFEEYMEKEQLAEAQQTLIDMKVKSVEISMPIAYFGASFSDEKTP